MNLDTIEFDASPNYSDRKRDINCIVLHHTGPGSYNGLISWLKNVQSGASAHYVLGKKSNEVKQLVKLSDKAWHAGKSRTIIDGNVVSNLNHNSIGIEIQNIGLMEKNDEDGKIYYERGRDLEEYNGEVQYGEIRYPNGTFIQGYYAPYPKEQIENIINLCKALVNKYPAITKDNIFTHYWIGMPVGRKNDPFGLDMDALKKKIFK